MTEKQLETAILSYLNTLPDCFAFKVNTTGIFDPIKKVYRKSNNRYAINGVSDIIAVHRDYGTLFIEVKTPKGHQSDAQKAFEAKVKKYNGNYFVIRGLDEIKLLLSDLPQYQLS